MTKIVSAAIRGAAAAIALTVALTLAACGSSPDQTAPDKLPVRKTSLSVPNFVHDAMRNVPEDALVGIGVSNSADISLAIQFADAQARASIANQLQGIARNMVNTFGASSGNDPATVVSYGEAIIQILANARLVGASPVDGDFDSNGAYWSVVRMPKDQAARTINQASNQALAAAKLKAPRATALDALERMNKAIAENSVNEAASAAKEEIPVR